MNKPPQIKKIKKYYGIELSDVEREDAVLEWRHRGSYLLNEEGEIIGLNLVFKQISGIGKLSGLTQLRTLYLGSNQISDIGKLSGLTQLRTLYLGSNQISDIGNLSVLTQLEILDLSDNEISDIGNLSVLTQLQILGLSKNRISEVNLPFLHCFKELNELELHGNPIQKIPKEIFDKNENVLKPVRDYLEDLEKGKAQNRVLKVIFIGNGSVGKTQIAKRLFEQKNYTFNSQHDSTHAIALLQRALGEVQLQLWDFAGQDIYHATHRLFMQTRALFVLVWDVVNERADFHEWKNKEYKNEKLLYWLEYAACFGQGSPILVLQNKVDSLAERRKGMLKKAQEYYKKHYPILDFLQVSAKTGWGFQFLEKTLQKHFRENEELRVHLQQELPTSWLNVREQVLSLQEEENKTLLVVDFEVLCGQEDVLKSANTILDYLHDTGVLYYRSGYFDNHIILNQGWAIEAIYKILDRESDYAEMLLQQKGQLDYEDLCSIWEKNGDGERKLFMDFMLSTELCFEVTENKRYKIPLKERSFVVPAFLPPQKPEEVLYWEEVRNIGVFEEKIDYRFFPFVFVQ
ncbi:MAG: COR domain-containing protein [Chitinophagales bacterium]